MLVSLKLDPKLVVIDSQVAVLATHNCLRHDLLHFLRHHADVSSIAAVIAEAIEADAVAELAEKNDIVLERDVRSPSATATTTATTTTAAATAATATTRARATAAACSCAPTAAAPAETCVSARGLRVRHATGLNISKSVAAAARRPRARPLTSARLLCATATSAGPLSCAGTRLLDAAATSAWTISASAQIGLSRRRA